MTVFAPAFGGALLRPGEDGYDEARRIWKRRDRPAPRADHALRRRRRVVEAVRFARAIRSCWSRCAAGDTQSQDVCDGGLMIDLSLMKAVRVDPGPERARGWRRSLVGVR